MRDEEHGERGDAAGVETPDEPLTVESLDAARTITRDTARVRAWLGALAPAWAGRRLSARARALRFGVVITLVATTLFALLGGPALVGAGFSRLYSSLTSAGSRRSLAMTRWRMIPPAPFAPGAQVSYTPDPANPLRVFACAVEGTSDVAVWVTDTGGRVWRQLLVAPLLSPHAPSCRVKIALDAPVVALLVVRARDSHSAACDALAVYGLTDLGSGALPLPNEPNACLADVWPSAASLYYWWTNNSQDALALSGIERSDTLGATWHEVPLISPFDPFSLAPALLDSGSADTIITQVYAWPTSVHPALNDLWRSLDGGNSWRRALNAPVGATILTTTEPGALTGARWPPTYAAIYSGGQLSPPWEPDYAPAALAALQPDGATWRTLPPLPLRPSPAPQRPAPTGVSVPLAVGPGGDLLVLGQKPGAAASFNPQPRLWLWAWDPVAGAWRMADGAVEARGWRAIRT
jgi:hypothetical protein